MIMNKISTLILHNLNKSKGQYISFGLIICLTAFILNIALVLAFQTSEAYDNRFKELNTADMNIIIPEMQDYDGLTAELENIDGIISAEKHNAVFVSATVREFAGSDFDMNTVFYNIDEERSVNCFDISDNERHEDTIYIPMYMTELGGFSVGDNITYSVDGSEISCKIGGIVSEMQYGNYGTGLIGGYFPENAYKKFRDEHFQNAVAEYSFMLRNNADITTVKTDITDFMKDKGIMLMSINDRESSKQTRTMVCTLLIVIFIVLAAIILAVSIFLSNFRIRSTIEDEMTQMGVLKALGYTNSMIINSAVIPYTIVGALATILGAGLSYTAIPSVADILAVQSGFSYTPVFDVKAVLIAVLVPTFCILIFSYIASKKIKTLQPINAIRGITGNISHNNILLLETLTLGTGFTLVLKQTFSSMGQNVLLFAVSFGIMILLSFSGTLL